MSRPAESFVAKCSSLFLSTTSFFKKNAMNTRNRSCSGMTFAVAAMTALVLTTASANAATSRPGNKPSASNGVSSVIPGTPQTYPLSPANESHDLPRSRSRKTSGC